jgi:hypothetical protein
MRKKDNALLNWNNIHSRDNDRIRLAVMDYAEIGEMKWY